MPSLMETDLDEIKSEIVEISSVVGRSIEVLKVADDYRKSTMVQVILVLCAIYLIMRIIRTGIDTLAEYRAIIRRSRDLLRKRDQLPEWVVHYGKEPQ